jgi:hypothetical protein
MGYQIGLNIRSELSRVLKFDKWYVWDISNVILFLMCCSTESQLFEVFSCCAFWKGSFEMKTNCYENLCDIL